MRIVFDNCNFSSTTGPNSFGTRLAKAFYNLGHEVVTDTSGADVSLVFIESTGRKLTPIIVQRLDGIWFNPQNYHTHNHRIKATWNIADGIVYQSEFDKKFITKMWDVHKNTVVIKNGIEVLPQTKFAITPLEQLRARYKMMFCCSANWHGQKRLSANIDMFKHIRTTIEPSSCLLVLGSNRDTNMLADNDVFYAGSQSHEVCAEVYAACNWMIHLSWLDHCPNVVVEALAQHTPVICSSDGGTRELINGYGIVVNEEKPYDFSLVDYDNPPVIDVTQITSLPTKDALCKAPDVDIKNVAQEYIRLFEHISLQR